MESGQTPPKKRRHIGTGFGLLAVQCISCAVVVLAVLILRLIGGGVFQQLRVYFQDAMQQNALTAAIHALWEDPAIYTTTTTVLPTTVTATTTTAGTGAEATTTTPAAGGEAGATIPENVATVAWTGGSPLASPVSGAVMTSGFGLRDNPFGDGQEFHRGVDLAVPLGTPIAAMWAGEVTAVDADGEGSLGRYVRLRHADGVEVLYAHCDAVTVTVGDTVAAGDTVATVGSTGRSTGAHLHVQVEWDGMLYDPTPMLPDATYV